MMLLSYFHGMSSMLLCLWRLEIMARALPWTFFSRVILLNGDTDELAQVPSPRVKDPADGSGKCGSALKKGCCEEKGEARWKRKEATKQDLGIWLKSQVSVTVYWNSPPTHTHTHTSKLSQDRMNCSTNKCKRKWLINPSHANWLAGLPYLQDLSNEWASCDSSQAPGGCCC